MDQPATDRIAALDLIRGIAVLGILAVNIAGFAGPAAATLSPSFPATASAADEAAHALVLLLFEGKMRALFSLLFGASMMLFVERADAAGRDGEALQLRRLGWLALFGYLHFLLLWWGDILFLYAVLGCAALALRRLEVRPLAIGAAAFFVLWHLMGAVDGIGALARFDAVQAGTATPAQLGHYAAAQRDWSTDAARQLAIYRGGYGGLIAYRAGETWGMPLRIAFSSLGETVPLMLLGMALYRSGFFAGHWPRKVLRRMALAGIVGGAVPTAVFIAWAWPRHFPVQVLYQFNLFWSAVPHLAMALGYAALLMLAMPAFARSAPGLRLRAAGRMAFSNYLATSLVMTFIFYGWGLGFAGRIGAAGQLGVVLAGWAAMLGWSAPWLRRFHQGPLEWLWRSLTEWRRLPLRR